MFLYFLGSFSAITWVTPIRLAEVVCALCHIPYATFGAHETLQKIHWKKFGQAQGFAYERKSWKFSEVLIFEGFPLVFMFSEVHRAQIMNVEVSLC